MKWIIGVLAVLSAASFVSAGDAPASLQERINREIAAFQPPWSPPKDELRGLVVVIDPVREGVPASRRQDELSLLTAEHMFHLFQWSGAVPILTRSEDRPADGIDEALRAAVARLPGAKTAGVAGRAHLILRIVYSSARPEAENAASTRTDLCSTLRQDVLEAAVSLLPSDAKASSADVVASPERKARGSTRAAHPLASRSGLAEGAQAVLLTFPLPPSDAPLSDRLAYRKNAQQLWKGVARFWKANAAELQSGQSDGVPATQPVPLYAREPKEAKLLKAAKQAWPFGTLPVEKAPWFCETYRRSFLSDRTIVYFEPQVTVEGETVVLRGATTYPQLGAGLVAMLQTLGVQSVRNEMRLLPEQSDLGEARFGACIAPMAHTFKLAAATSGPQTQLLYGEPAFLLDRQAGFLLAQASDGYCGWVREDSIRPMAREEFERYLQGEHGVLRRAVETKAGLLRTGSRLRVASRSGDRASVRLPDGGTLELPAGDLTLTEDSQRVETRVNAALDLLYIPYLFGARSPIGLDCSGMVGSVGDLAGMSMARDAAQQCLSGKLVGTRWYREGLRAGDQIYFIDELGKIFHTGMMLSPTHFVYCSPPEVQISTFVKGERLYNPHWDETFFIVKRP
jgi:gamma-D-glutamyl-L-lysine dipeptidyl-peptidase